MAKYVVTGNKHYSTDIDPKTGERKVYHKGDVVESDKDLTKMYPNKFAYQQVFAAEEKSKEAIQEAEQEAAEIKHKAREEARKKAEAAAKAAAKDVEEEDQEEEPSDLGNDVTEEFEAAADKKVKIYKKGRHYQITDENGELLSGESFTKKEMTEFVDGYEA